MKTNRIVSLFLAVSLLMLVSCSKDTSVISQNTDNAETVQSRYTDVPDSVKKSETVYVNLKNDGKASLVNVTDWLHADKAKVAVSDTSNLKNIKDIKGNCVPETSGNSLTWHMDSTDLYYSGTSETSLPIEFDINYYLDKKEVTSDVLKGKSGNVTIEVKAKNTCFKTNEKGNRVYLPMITAGLVILPESTFSSVEIENGLCVSDGAKQIVVGLSFPGMAESLGLDETLTLGNMEISDSFRITAKANDFSLTNIYFVSLPVCSMSGETLIPGTEKEAAALIHDMENIMSIFSDIDLNVLSDAFSNSDSIENLTDSLSKAINIYNSNKKLLSVMDKYLTDENIETLSNLSEVLSDPKNTEALELLKNPVIRSFLGDLPSLLESADEMSDLASQLQEDMKDPEVKEAFDSLPQTLETLSSLQNILNENKPLIDALSAFASEDLTSLTDILKESDSGSVLSTLSKNSDELMPRIKDWIAFGNEYGLFSGDTTADEISLMFVFMTESI